MTPSRGSETKRKGRRTRETNDRNRGKRVKRWNPILTALVLAVFPICPSLVPAAPIYPLKKSANGRYLVDQSNTPVMLVGDSPQALMVNLTTNQAAAFFADRAGYGFNTVWLNLLCATYTGGRADASTI